MSETRLQIGPSIPIDQRIAHVETALAEQRADAFVARGISAGKIVAANRAFWHRGHMLDANQAEKALADSPVLNGHTPVFPPIDGDAIIANSGRFNAARMGDYERIAQYAKENNCTFEKALEAVG